MKLIKLSLFLIIIMLINSCSSVVVKDRLNQFIKVDGTQFTYQDKPYYFTGTNFWYGCYLGSSGPEGDRLRLKNELDELQKLGITNLRILGASEASELKKVLSPAIQTKPGIYNEKLLEGLDYLLVEMSKRNMHAVVFLNNYWEWSGGMNQYLTWLEKTEPFDTEDPNADWPAFMNNSASFCRDKEANKLFYEYIEMLLNRENTITGELYKNDPVIMAWQLANEPRPGWQDLGEKYIDDYFNWINETAQFIKSIDPYHLVSTGSEGVVGSLMNPDYYMKAHSSKNIDYAVFHLWAANWGWYDPQNSDGTFSKASEIAMDYISEHIMLAEKLNKPLVLEEFGINRDEGNYSRDSEVAIRNKYYKMIFDAVYSGAENGKPIAGTNFWAWGGYGRTSNSDFKWRPGDPFTGDPPHEPQGMYSVFNTDKATIEIIKENAKMMNALRMEKITTAGRN